MAVKDFSRVSPCLNLRRLAGQSFCRLQRSGKVSRACVSQAKAWSLSLPPGGVVPCQKDIVW